MDDRFTRQRRLPEVGEVGQARLAAARVEVAAGDPAAEMHSEYLLRAGVGVVARVPNRTPEPFPHVSSFAHESARALAAGAYRALTDLRSLLGLVSS